MDMSDSDGSDNEMFACKQEYNNFKQHFNAKSEKGKTTTEYGGGGGVKPAETVSEYGGDDNRVAAVGNKFGHGAAPEAVGRASDQGAVINRNTVGGGKRPSLGEGERGRGGVMRHGESHNSSYGGRQGEERTRSRERRRSRSGDRKRRSRSREGRHGGGRSRSRERRRSRSRGDRASPRRDGGRGRGGWGRDRERGRRDRDEQSRNMEDQVKKAKEMGVEMPKYFKPGAVNPLSYAEQVQKRKLMWSKPASGGSGVSGGGQGGVGAGAGGGGAPPVQAKPTPPPSQKTSFNKWEATNFGDEKANEKFRRLMGIKTPSNELATVPGAAPHANQDKIKEDLEKNYEVARQQTHRNRGLGLGFSNLEPTMPAEQYLPNPTPPPPSNPYLSYSQPKPTTGGIWTNRPAAGNINFVRKHH